MTARTPEQCCHRGPAWAEGDTEFANCRLVGQIVGLRDGEAFRVRRDACVACCRFNLPSAERMSPALASLVLDATAGVIARGGPAGGDVAHAERLRHHAIAQLDTCLPERPTPFAVASSPRLTFAANTPGRVGLVGWNTASGIGSMNRDLAVHGLVHRWLIPLHSTFPTLPDPSGRCKIDYFPSTMVSDRALNSWMRGLDWVLFVEVPFVRELARRAREAGVQVACVPMWEMAHPGLPWLRDVDLVICPNQWAFDRFGWWKERYGFTWDVVYVPWPIDTRLFRFRRRARCQRFVFVNGTAGMYGKRLDGSWTRYSRKGLGLVFEAARRLPTIPFLVYSQVSPHRALPANVEFRAARRDRSQLYRDGDVCVQPSHWEGLGLQLLECQAAGMPLVTTDAPPMNEFRPLRAVPADDTEVITANGNHPFTAHLVSPERLAATLAELHGTAVDGASRSARTFVEREHSWSRAAASLREHLVRRSN
jgi:glycosyltransferase involved in cell wall biosynthesis